MRGSNESGLRDIRPNHLFQRAVCQTKSEAEVKEKIDLFSNPKSCQKHSGLSPCCQIHFQGLASIGEDVESDLSSFLLQIRDKFLQKRDPVNLEEQDDKLFKEVRQDEKNMREEVRSLRKIRSLLTSRFICL